MPSNVIPINSGIRGDVQAMQPLPDWAHELAYQLWAFVHSQNGAKVARALTDGTYTDDGGIVPDDAYENDALPCITITPQAVNKWCRSENWIGRWADDVRQAAPAIHSRVASNLASLSLEAEQFLADFLTGRIVPKDGVDAKMLAERAKTAQDILNRAGHQPHTKQKDGSLQPAPQVDHKRSIAGKSMEEKRRMALGIED